MVSERVLRDHTAGVILKDSSLTFIESLLVAERRTQTVMRPLRVVRADAPDAQTHQGPDDRGLGRRRVLRERRAARRLVRLLRKHALRPDLGRRLVPHEVGAVVDGLRHLRLQRKWPSPAPTVYVAAPQPTKRSERKPTDPTAEPTYSPYPTPRPTKRNERKTDDDDGGGETPAPTPRPTKRNERQPSPTAEPTKRNRGLPLGPNSQTP